MNWMWGLDQNLFHLTNAVWTNPPLDALMPALSRAGNLGVVWLVLLGGIAAFGKKTGRKIALAGLVALAIGFAASEAIKELTVRPRPFAVLPDVRLLVSAPHSYAFPSGHTTSSFAAAGGAALAARRLLGRVPAWGWGMWRSLRQWPTRGSTSACTGRRTWRPGWSLGLRAVGRAPG